MTMNSRFSVTRTKVLPVLCQRLMALRMIALVVDVLAVDIAHGEGWYWHGTAQAKAVVFFIIVGAFALLQQYLTNRDEKPHPVNKAKKGSGTE